MTEAVTMISDREVRGEPLGRALHEAIALIDGEMATSNDWAGRRCRIFHTQDPATGLTYLIVRGNRAYTEAMLDLPGVEDYSYWSSEEPEGVTRAEWLARRDQWNVLIPGNPRLPDIMDTWLLRENENVRPELLVGPEGWVLPTTGRRVRKVLTDVAFAQMLKTRQAAGQDILSTAMGDLMDAQDLVRSDEAEAVRKLNGELVATGDWELYSEGQGVSLVRSNLDRLNVAVARLRAAGA